MKDEPLVVEGKVSRDDFSGGLRVNADKLLTLPPFMLGAQAGLGAGDVRSGFDLTGHFLEQFVFHPLNRPLPPARVWMLDKLAEAGRL